MPDKRRIAAAEAALAKNRHRRETAEAELDTARRELRALLARADDAGVTVSRMASLAGVSRETAHKWLRETREGRDHA